ncbi:MAG: response regulator transcription factor [Rhodoferax sp.]|nr:response regulator transcription factor [Rhodoferax sp.]
MKNILLVDDLPEALAMLEAAVRQAFDAPICTHAESVAQAQNTIRTGRFDLALVDLNLGDGQGHEVIRLLAQAQPACVVVVASIYDDDDNLFRALQAGAQGYLLKYQNTVWLVHQLKGIAQGRPPLSPAIARRLLRFFQKPAVNQAPAAAELTPRERDVLGLLAQGVQIADIALALGISRHTVGDHVKNLYRKLNINSRAEAALHARGMGLV